MGMSQVESNDIREMTKYMADIWEDVSEEGNKWRQNRRGWMNKEIGQSIEERRVANKCWRRMRKSKWTNDEESIRLKEAYIDRKKTHKG